MNMHKPTPDMMLNSKQVAELFEVSTSTILKISREDPLFPIFVTVDRERFWSKTAVLRFMEEHPRRVPTGRSSKPVPKVKLSKQEQAARMMQAVAKNEDPPSLRALVPSLKHMRDGEREENPEMFEDAPAKPFSVFAGMANRAKVTDEGNISVVLSEAKSIIERWDEKSSSFRCDCGQCWKM